MLENIETSTQILGVSEDTIMDLIKTKTIDYVLEDGVFMVDVNSVGVFHKFDGDMRDFTDEFRDSIVDNNISIMRERFHRKPLKSNTFWLNWKVFNKFNIYEIDDITLKLSQYFPKHSNEVFYQTMKNTMMSVTYENVNDLQQTNNQYVFSDYSNKVESSVFELDGYVLIFRVSDDGLGYIINDIFRKEELKTYDNFTKKIFVKKYETLQSDYDVEEINEEFKDYQNLMFMRNRYISKNIHLEEGNNTKDEIREFITLNTISDVLWDKLTEFNIIGNKENDTYTFMDIEIIKHLLQCGLDDNSQIFEDGKGGVGILSTVKCGSGLYPPTPKLQMVS